MYTFLLLTGFLLTVVFFLIDKDILTVNFITQRHILDRLEKNKTKEMQLQAEFENLISSYEAWSQKAYPYNDVTYSEYVALMKEKSGIEYSDNEFKKLKSCLKKNQLSEYLEKIRDQEEAVIALQADLDCQKKNLQTQKIVAAS